MLWTVSGQKQIHLLTRRIGCCFLLTESCSLLTKNCSLLDERCSLQTNSCSLLTMSALSWLRCSLLAEKLLSPVLELLSPD